MDVERGRTVKGWRPRRLGGGLGNTRKGGNEENTKYSGRDDFDGRDRFVDTLLCILKAFLVKCGWCFLQPLLSHALIFKDQTIPVYSLHYTF